VVTSIIDSVTKEVAYKAVFVPRPITTTNDMDNICLSIRQASFAKICRLNEITDMYEFIISVKMRLKKRL